MDKGRKRTGKEDKRIVRGGGRRPRRGPRADTDGGLPEDAMAALVEVQFPNSPKRRRKTPKKAPPAPRKPGPGKAGRRKAAPAIGGDFQGLRSMAEASGDPAQAEALWTDEVLELLGRAAEQIYAEVEVATAEYAEALSGRTRTASLQMPASAEAAELEPAFLRLEEEDFDDDDTPLQVFDADALGETIDEWEEPSDLASTTPGEGSDPTVDDADPRAGSLRGSTTSDRSEWNSMLTYLATQREAAIALRAARSLQRRAAETVAELSPRRRLPGEVGSGPLLVVGLLLLGWAASYYLRTGDLRISLGMLAWASCAGCALVMFQQRPG